MHSKAQEDYTSVRVSVRCSELTATINDLGTYNNEVCCLLFKCAREFFQRESGLDFSKVFLAKPGGWPALRCYRTSPMSAFGGKADIEILGRHIRF
jgi:hypothetical protein